MNIERRDGISATLCLLKHLVCRYHIHKLSYPIDYFRIQNILKAFVYKCRDFDHKNEHAKKVACFRKENA
ncbi:hypothetical protein C3432_02640 [Citrobacter amalonaticus]|uniref:Uncharacterized protein n=1 Tax=Citrobacter amalonaticus TaxID=35703 RepID=A0A2S4S2Y7_CITAM|nr:hypothetical protein C3432_02640 [Citrobacter amalonaticus]POT77765.1 hypothetical protein C3436_10310 [Citrobacter amalonaticus]POU68217.1 hypothetical protein C3430_03845 [Citrobacter amalonaticus]POV07820.1 hypothetical protein C3424_03855 [Citrobacter amalonaticus]